MPITKYRDENLKFTWEFPKEDEGNIDGFKIFFTRHSQPIAAPTVVSMVPKTAREFLIKFQAQDEYVYTVNPYKGSKDGPPSNTITVVFVGSTAAEVAASVGNAMKPATNFQGK